MQSNFSNNVEVFFLSNQSLKIKINLDSFSSFENKTKFNSVSPPGGNTVQILSLNGPKVVQSGSELMLDCNFSYLDEEENQLDIKWYFNGSPIPVYQWVPSMKKGPQVIGELFKHKLDLDYVAHNDTYKRHRALRVVQSDHRFSGTYQCKVSSFVDEDFQQKEVLVYSKWSTGVGVVLTLSLRSPAEHCDQPGDRVRLQQRRGLP